MNNADNQPSHSHKSRSHRPHSGRRRALAHFWSEWRLELVVGFFVLLAIFLLVEQMQIRETLAGWLARAVEQAAVVADSTAEAVGAFVRNTTLSDLTAYLLLSVAAFLIVWRARWRLMHMPRFTERQCPRCGGDLYRVHRHLPDRILHILVPVRRYRCRDKACGWSGLRVHRRH